MLGGKSSFLLHLRSTKYEDELCILAFKQEFLRYECVATFTKTKLIWKVKSFDRLCGTCPCCLFIIAQLKKYFLSFKTIPRL